MNLSILTSCCGYLSESYKNVIFIFCNIFQIAHDENIAPVPKRDKTKADVEIISNCTFPITIEINVNTNETEIIITAILILDLVISLMDLVTSPAGQRYVAPMSDDAIIPEVNTDVSLYPTLESFVICKIPRSGVIPTLTASCKIG